MRNRLNEEIKTWIQYFLLALFAAVWAYLIIIFRLYPPRIQSQTAI
jgi:hypothetical protein